VKLLDLKSGASVFTLSAGKQGHDGEVTCVDCHSSDNLLTTGSVDCTALLINVRTGKVTTLDVCVNVNQCQSKIFSVAIIAELPRSPRRHSRVRELY